MFNNDDLFVDSCVISDCNINDEFSTIPLSAIQVSFKAVVAKLINPLPTLEADNGYFYRMSDACLYSSGDDARIGKVGQGAGNTSLSMLVILLCLLLSFLRY